jgi:hypothetical protein
MIGQIFITRSGYDPERGRHVKDPYLGPTPTMGACRPDIRKRLTTGDHIFTISGKVSGVSQFVMGGFEIAEKISATQAYERFPEQRLSQRSDGQLAGNVIITASGEQHELDTHTSFDTRINNYVVGREPLVLRTPREIALGRAETLEILREILKRKGNRPFDILGRSGARLTENQIVDLRDWMTSIRRRAS